VTSSRWFYSIVAILALFSLSVGQAFADLESCSASLNNHTLNPDSTNSVTINVHNQSAGEATSVLINRPAGNYHLASSGVSGCSVDQSDDNINVHSCSIGADQSIDIPLEVTTDGPSSGESWSVNMSDNGGVTDISCSGDLSSRVGEGGGEGDSGGDGGSGGTTLEISSVSVTGSGELQQR